VIIGAVPPKVGVNVIAIVLIAVEADTPYGAEYDVEIAVASGNVMPTKKSVSSNTPPAIPPILHPVFIYENAVVLSPVISKLISIKYVPAPDGNGVSQKVYCVPDTSAIAGKLPPPEADVLVTTPPTFDETIFLATASLVLVDV
jgi:hypothetical protein